MLVRGRELRNRKRDPGGNRNRQWRLHGIASSMDEELFPAIWPLRKTILAKQRFQSRRAIHPAAATRTRKGMSHLQLIDRARRKTGVAPPAGFVIQRGESLFRSRRNEDAIGFRKIIGQCGFRGFEFRFKPRQINFQRFQTLQDPRFRFGRIGLYYFFFGSKPTKLSPATFFAVSGFNASRST